MNNLNNLSWKIKMFPWLIPAVILGASVPFFLRLVEMFGHFIPQDDIQTDYLIGVVWSLILGASIIAWPVRIEDKKHLLLLWVLKTLLIFTIMVVYENSFKTDSFNYFNGALYSLDQRKGLGMDTINVPVINLFWIQNQCIPASFHAVKASFALVGLIAIYIFYRAFVIFSGKEQVRLLYALVLFPSIFFWASIPGKDPLMLLGLACYVYGICGWQRRRRPGYLIILFSGAVLAIFMRLWFVLILAMPLAALFFLQTRGFLRKTLFLTGMAAFVAVSLAALLKYFNIHNVEQFFYCLNVHVLNFDKGGSSLGTYQEFLNFKDIALFVPRGMLVALFRPFPGEIHHAFGWMAGFENIFLLLLSLLALVKTRGRDLKDPLVLCALLLILTWAAAYACFSFNLGTISRYRLQILPVFLGLLLFQACKDRAPKLPGLGILKK